MLDIRTAKPTYFLLVFGLLLLLKPAVAQAQQKVLIDDIWLRYAFYPKQVQGINWLSGGSYYTSLEKDNKGEKIVKYNIANGKQEEVIFNTAPYNTDESAFSFDAYTFSADESQILLTTQSTPLYRYSSMAQYFIYNRQSKDLSPLADSANQMFATFSPDGKKIAYVANNNIFVYDIAATKTTQLTTDGHWNHIINGRGDWVYEEEFELVKAFYWSPDSKSIAFVKYNESQVPEYNMQLWGGLYPEDYTFKYPKAGEDNAKVSVWVTDLTGKATNVNLPAGPDDFYIPRILWTGQPHQLGVVRMNRLQNQWQLFHCNVKTNTPHLVLEEKNDTWIDVHDDLVYLANGDGFFRTTEESGYRHFVLYNMQGQKKQQLTQGKFEVSEYLGFDAQKGVIYYTSTEKSALEKHAYSVSLSGKKQTLTAEPGDHEINLSGDFKYFIDTYSTVNKPTQTVLCQTKNGKKVRDLELNEALQKRLKTYALGTHEFLQVPAADGQTQLNAMLMKPAGFDPSKKYPLLMHVYGGPGSQKVTNSYDPFNYFWHQHLLSKGYLVAIVDNRGTGGRGAHFEKQIYGRLGELEIKDQVAAAQHFGQKEYIDANRIGLWGWSFGGYMASLAVTVGDETFKAALAVAPVTNWRFYDTIYTERFLGLPNTNASGYDNYSPITHATEMKGNFMMIHGTGDDNVHFQNMVDFQDALINANKDFNSFFYPNRNHGIYGGITRYHLYNKMTKFVTENL